MSTTATVAVLFCDLVDSTARLTRLGDTAGDEFRRRFFDQLNSDVATAGGVVVKNLGDGLMVAFEHSTVDAVDCAAAMHQGIGHVDPDDPPRLRIGISVGEVSNDDGDWFGTPVVEAARLCSAAEPEQTLATSVVRNVVGSRGDRHVFDSMGSMTLKGLGSPVDVVAVADAGPLPTTPPSRGPADPETGSDPVEEKTGSTSRRPFAIVGVLVVVVALLGAGWWSISRDDGDTAAAEDESVTDAAMAEQVTSPQGYTPEFEVLDCPAAITEKTPGAECGELVVPELRSEPDGRQIGVNVVHAPARTATAAPPVLMLDLNEQIESTSLRDVADVYAVTVRGLSSTAEPKLECEEIRQAWTDSFSLPSGDLGAVDARVTATEECAARLREEGVQLEGYNMVEVAHDLRDLALTLGLDSVSVAASDVATTAAVEFTRANPGLVDSLLLANPTPPGESTVADPARNLSESLDRLDALCGDDPDCEGTFGDLDAAFGERFDDLAAQPIRIETLPVDEEGSSIDVYLDGQRLAAALAAALSSTGQLPYVPTAVFSPVTAEQLIAGAAIDKDYRLFVAPGVTNATVLSFVCSYDGNRPRSAELSSATLGRFAGADEPALRKLCEVWDVPSIFDKVAAPLIGDVPVFIAQGGIATAGVNDWGGQMEETLDDVTVARFPTMSEDLIFVAPRCLRDLRRDFLLDPRGDHDAAAESCGAESTAVDFVGAG